MCVCVEWGVRRGGGKHVVRLNKRSHGDILKSATQFDQSAHQLPKLDKRDAPDLLLARGVLAN